MQKPKSFRYALVASLFILGVWPVLVFRKVIGNKIFFTSLVVLFMFAIPDLSSTSINYSFIGQQAVMMLDKQNTSDRRMPPLMYGIPTALLVTSTAIVVGMIASALLTIIIEYTFDRWLMKKILARIPQLRLP